MLNPDFGVPLEKHQPKATAVRIEKEPCTYKQTNKPKKAFLYFSVKNFFSINIISINFSMGWVGIFKCFFFFFCTKNCDSVVLKYFQTWASFWNCLFDLPSLPLWTSPLQWLQCWFRATSAGASPPSSTVLALLVKYVASFATCCSQRWGCGLTNFFI